MPEGIRRAAVACAIVLAAFAFLPASRAQHAVLPAGFDDQLIGELDFFPTALTFTPDGRAFVLAKEGSIWVFRDGQKLAQPLLTLAVNTVWERGLLGIALHPEFSENGFFYLYYTSGEGSLNYSGTPSGRVSRFQISTGNADRADPSSEVILLDNIIVGGIGVHQGGAVRVGPDRSIYVSVGDGGDGPAAQSLQSLHGKILRLTLDGSIPEDNPFVNAPDARPEIWAYGLRNPFRFTIDPRTGNLWIGDVGQQSWEELNLGIAGANYGWPLTEGPEPPGVAGITYPVYSYPHGVEWDSGGAIIVGPFYDGELFPEEFRGNLFFADWVGGAVWRAAGGEEDEGEFQVLPFARGLPAIIDIAVGPEGALYFVRSASSDVFHTEPVEPQLRKITYDPAAPRAPTARASAEPRWGLLPLNVQFSSMGSFDPEGEALSYVWDLGDGNGASEPDPAHVYTAAGIHQARLTIHTADGRTGQSLPVAIHAGNEPPLVELQEPAAGASYRAGDVIRFAGWASDPQDGALPDSALSWRVVFHHDTHTHPFLGPLSGVAEGEFEVPVRGETSANTWYRVHLTATDSGGLSRTKSADIVPVRSTVTLRSQPAGLTVHLDGSPRQTPHVFEGVVGFLRDLGAPAEQEAEGQTFRFERWSHGAPRNHTIATPEVAAEYEAVFLSLPADLAVTATAGKEFALDIAVGNAGPGTAPGVELTADVPSHLTVQSAVAATGQCLVATPVRCQLGHIPAGQGVTITITLVASAGGAATFAISAEAEQPDPEPENNVVQITTLVADFALAAQPARVALIQGQAVVDVLLTSLSGPFDEPVGLTCPQPPAGLACNFSPATVTPGASGAQARLMITRTQAQAARISPGLYAAVIFLPLIIVGGCRRRRKNVLAAAGLLLLMMAFHSACGGSGGQERFGETQLVQLTVVATSGSLARSATMTVEIR
jgi:glucose/arabinose dehydrogenase